VTRTTIYNIIFQLSLRDPETANYTIAKVIVAFNSLKEILVNASSGSYSDISIFQFS
jgi:hypothetical protein